MMKYKGSDDYHSFRVKSEKGNEIEISDEETLTIQRNFSFINSINPQQIDQSSINYFQQLEQDIALNKERYYQILPRILPTSVYNHYVLILRNTRDPHVHKIISSIIVILTTDLTDSLLELSKYDLLGAVESSVLKYQQFPQSMDSLLQILCNFLDDPSQQVSMAAHKLFPIDYLIRILNYIKSNNEQEKIENSILLKAIINKWIKCIFASLDRYPSDITKNEAIYIIIELAAYFDLIKEETLLCQCLCNTVFLFLERNLIGFIDFEGRKYPDFIHFLSQMNDVDVQASAFRVIGKLTMMNKLQISADFLRYFEIVQNANPGSNQCLLSSSIYVINSLLVNSVSSDVIFNLVNENMECLINVYDISNFEMKKELTSLYSSYLSHVLHCKINLFANLSQVISTMVDRIFDFIESADPLSFDDHPMKALLDSIHYVYETNQSVPPTIQGFIAYVMERVTYLSGLDSECISEFANVFIKTVNELQSEKQNN